MTTLDNRQLLIDALGGIRAADTYTVERFVEGPANMLAFMAAKEFDHKKHNLYIFGPTGSGKSHVASIAARQFVGRTRIGTIKLACFAREIRSCRDGAAEYECIRNYAALGILIIDDLGIEKMTEFVLNLLYEIVDYRYMNKPGGLIVTTNLSLSELGSKIGDDRIPSRLAQMCKIINLKDKDHRMPC